MRQTDHQFILDVYHFSSKIILSLFFLSQILTLRQELFQSKSRIQKLNKKLRYNGSNQIQSVKKILQIYHLVYLKNFSQKFLKHNNNLQQHCLILFNQLVKDILFQFDQNKLMMQGIFQSLSNSNNRILLMITDNEKGFMIEHFMAQVKTEDLLNIGFMKPIQVALRTHKTDKQVPADSLPTGLMIAAKSSINDNKYNLKRIMPIEPEHKSLEDLRAKHVDNFISLLKKPVQKDQVEARRNSERVSIIQKQETEQRQPKAKHTGVQLGICISMCGQQKKKLKSTLVKVADNIDELIRSGLSPDDIFVVVVIDGVTNVDKSLFEYFEQFERQSQIFLQQDEKLTLRKKYEHQVYHSQVEKDEPLNYSKFLFKKNEFEERVQSKFVCIRKKYDQILRIKKSIQNIKKQNNKDNDNLKMIVNRLADKQKNILKKINQGKQDKSIVINQESIMKELANSEEQCNQYINTRSDLSYVSVYRVPTTSLSEQCKLRQSDQKQNQGAEIQSQLDSQRLMNQSIDRTSIRESLRLKKGIISKTIRYVNLMFCIKYKESGKLSSHNWFLNGFCQELNPRYTILLDVGVRPYPDAIYKMYRHMKVNQGVGAVCGYMRLHEQLVEDQEMIKDEDVDCITGLMLNIFDIQRAQQIQTHYEHLLDKSFQALFGYIHVVPGSFSGYNMKALRPPDKKDDLLQSYFRSIDEKIVTNKIVPSQFQSGTIVARVLLPKTIWKRFTEIDPDSEQQMLYNQNTNLAENRVLCLGIHKNGKDIAFLPNVYAEIEPIKHINDLMEVSKKQINGGMFSFQKTQQQFEHQSQKKRHKFLVKFQFFYLSFSKLILFFGPSLLIFALQFATEIIQDDFLASLFATESATGLGNVIYRTFSNIIIFIYALCILAIFFFSIHLNSKDKRYVYYAHLVSTVLGVFTIIAAIVFIVQTFFSILKVSQSYLQLNFLTQLKTFMAPDAAMTVVLLLRLFMYLAIIMIYLPALTYVITFRKFGIFWQIFVGAPSYIFYLPTYLCILPIYSRCRLDEVSSAGKGMMVSKNSKLKQSWKVVKMIDVAKFFIWNMIVGIILLSLQNILLVKFFLLLFLLFVFVLLSVIKWIPGFIYIIKYLCNRKQNPLEPSEKQKNQNIADMRLKIFDTIKRFQDDFTFNIKESFQEAAIQAEIKEFQRQNKKAALQKQNAEALNKAKQVQLARNENIQVNNLFNMNQQTNLGVKVQNIRQSSAVKPKFYPFIANKDSKQAYVEPSKTPLELLLLKNKLGEEVAKNSEHKQEEIKLKKYQNFRATIKPFAL